MDNRSIILFFDSKQLEFDVQLESDGHITFNLYLSIDSMISDLATWL